MAESNVQSKVAITASNPQTRTPRWGKRILENIRIAGAATAFVAALALSGCGTAQVQPVAPVYANPSPIPEQVPRFKIYFLPNPIYDLKIGTYYHRPDGMDAILFRPELYGYPMLIQPVPILAFAIFGR